MYEYRRNKSRNAKYSFIKTKGRFKRETWEQFKNTKDVIISVDGENSIYTDVVKIETVVRNKTIKCLRNKDYNFIKKINEKFLRLSAEMQNMRRRYEE